MRRRLQNPFVFLSAPPPPLRAPTDAQNNLVAHPEQNTPQDSLASLEARVRLFFSYPRFCCASGR